MDKYSFELVCYGLSERFFKIKIYEEDLINPLMLLIDRLIYVDILLYWDTNLDLIENYKKSCLIYLDNEMVDLSLSLIDKSFTTEIINFRWNTYSLKRNYYKSFLTCICPLNCTLVTSPVLCTKCDTVYENSNALKSLEKCKICFSNMRDSLVPI